MNVTRKIVVVLGLLMGVLVVASARAQEIHTIGASGFVSASSLLNSLDVTVGGPSATQIRDSVGVGANGGISLSGGVVPSYNNCFWNDTNSCVTINVRVRERLFVGDAVLMNDNNANSYTATWLGGLSPASPFYLARDAQLLAMTDNGTIAVSGMALASQAPNNIYAPIGLGGYARNDGDGGTLNPKSAWAEYLQCDNVPSVPDANCYGAEIDPVNFTANATGDPYINTTAMNGTFALWLAAGGGGSPAPTNPNNTAIVTRPNGTTWNVGINFRADSLTKDGNGLSQAIQMGLGAQVEWFSAASTVALSAYSPVANDLELTGPAGSVQIAIGSNNNFQIGGPDVVAPAIQVLGFNNVLSGTANTAAANVLFVGSQGTGTGKGGNVVFEVANAGTSGSTQNPDVPLLTLESSLQVVISSSSSLVTVTNNTSNPKLQVNNSSATSGNDGAVFSAFTATAATPASLTFAKSASGTLGAQAAVATGNALGQVTADGSDGTAFQDSSAILFKVNGTVSAGVVPGEMDFRTATSAGAMTTALTIGPSQLVNLPLVATGTPAASLCIDASNNIIKKTTTGSCV